MDQREFKEGVMKALWQWIATAVLVVAGVVLLCVPAGGQVKAGAFVPTRFAVTDAGTVGKMDAAMEGWLRPSREVQLPQLYAKSAKVAKLREVKQRQVKQQIPAGNDSKKSESNGDGRVGCVEIYRVGAC